LPAETRAGRKLRAAIEQFGLAAHIDGARAIDVGASTGGFTAELLARGARAVTAIDVGHDQLLPELRRDARVTVLERAHMKTLSLDQAPGPFDFFTVDVSFIAARTMLRPLAFRLRDGARGVILLKPQFELPAAQVKGGDVRDPQLRRRALALLTDKAERLGFALQAQQDSPVPGGEGTVEILTCFEFRGRPATMPRPGEQRPRSAAPPRARIASGPTRLFLVAAPGLEPLVADEARRMLPGAKIEAAPGGVELVGEPALIARSNLLLRLPTRVLLRVGVVEAREFSRLRRGAAALPWAAWLPAGARVSVRAAASRSRLYHTGAIAENLALALDDAVGAEVDKAPAEDRDDAPLSVLARGHEDRFTLSLDTSGARLHRRGWRQEGGTAPLRETLAAALLAVAELADDEPVCDPMCGSGTIAIEAALRQIGRAPGLDRRFAFERFVGHDAAAWEALRNEARAAERPRPLAIVAADADAEQIVIARRNATRAGVAELVRIEQAELDALTAPAPRGLLVTNPPYGRRAGSRSAIPRVYAQLARALRGPFSAWRAAILVEDRKLLAGLGVDWARARALDNGGLKVWIGRREPRR
jgi:putative N6-adenine-specific DNA methylase